MMFLLAIPLVRNILAALALMAVVSAGYYAWSWHLQELGAAEERAKAAARAEALQEKVIQESNHIEAAIVPSSEAHKQLLKDWTRPND